MSIVEKAVADGCTELDQLTARLRQEMRNYRMTIVGKRFTEL